MNDLATFGRALQKLISAPILKRGFCEAELVLSKEVATPDNLIVGTQSKWVFEFQSIVDPRAVPVETVEAWAREQGWTLLSFEQSYSPGYVMPLGFDYPQAHSTYTFQKVGP